MSSPMRANVLLVDDRKENLFALEALLSGLGENLVCATSAREALRHLLVEDFALILLDVQMPGLNGFELAEIIREREKTQDTPIIFISAVSIDDHYVFKGYSLGAVDYLTKPINPEILRSKVTSFIKLYKQREEIRRQAELLEEANSALDRANIDLEKRVKRRTAELQDANRSLELEVAARTQSEARLATEHAITLTLASADSLEAAAPAILRLLCEYMKAEISLLWMLNDAKTELVCTHIETAAGDLDLSAFIQHSRSGGIRRGVGLPGQVWEQKATVWLGNAYRGKQYPRSTFAAALGLHSAVGLPIKMGSEFYGVIECFTSGALAAKERLSDMLEAIGSEIGQFFHKVSVEAERENLLRREKHLRQQAENASRLKDEFLATVSHELRTPLNSILGWGQMLHTGQLGPDDQRNALETIHRNAQSQAQLIDDLLDTSRLITGNLLLDLSPTEVIPAIRAAVEVVRPTAESKSITLTAEYTSDIESITCDPRRLQQMVWNLLSNAVKFTPAGGTVKVSFERKGESVQIAVTDSGQGISPEFLPFVFDRFRQADASSTRKHEGLGLGLAIVKHLAELHGGRVSAYSDGVGRGSTFVIELPVTRTANIEQIVPRMNENGELAGDEPRAKLAGVRVLVVDDDADSCEMMRYALGASGADVKTSLSAADAIKEIDGWKPDVLVTDINMPGEDGYSLLKKVRLKTSPNGENIPAIALTAMARPEDSDNVMAAGFDLHISKPVDLEDLTAAILRIHNSR